MSNSRNPAEIAPPDLEGFAAQTLDDLLSRHGEDFLRCAYRTVLGRAPDPEGMTYYLARLYGGRGKVEILSQLALSAEGRNRSEGLPGLARLVSAHQKSQRGWLNWLRAGRETHYRMNRLEELLGSLHLRVHRGEKEMARRLADLPARLPAVREDPHLTETHNPPELENSDAFSPTPEEANLGQHALRWLNQLQILRRSC